MRDTTRAGPVAVALLCLVVAGCGGSAALAPVGREPREQPVDYVVQRGDTLYYVAWRFARDWSDIARYNALTPPYTIHAGQRLRLTPPPRAATPAPVQPSKPATAAPARPTPERPAAATAQKPATAAPPPASKPATAPPAPRSARAGIDDDAPVARWAWPARGKVVGSFGRSGGNGIEIAGEEGDAVMAAAPGTVVYSGSGLIGYGKLIIVKHNKNFLSAYAHNENILVSEGERVDLGQQIAQMGSSGTDRVKLHFEIRRDGKPVDPKRYLPD